MNFKKSSGTRNLANWQFIKENIYYEDGSFRDIYIQDTGITDWEKWIDFVNNNYRITSYAEDPEMAQSLISKQAVINRLLKCSDEIVHATVWLDNISVNCHFFSSSEIENDISPREIISIEHHLKILDYLKSISVALGKKVILTAENQPNDIYIEVDQDVINLFSA